MRPALAFSSLALACAGAVFSPAASASCYVVYSASQQVVYRSTEPPVNLSYQLHQTVPVLAPGAALVFTADSHGCDTEVNLLVRSPLSQLPSGAENARAVLRAPRAPRG